MKSFKTNRNIIMERIQDNIFSCILSVILIFSLSNIFAIDYLPADAAFRTSLIQTNSKQVQVEFDLEKGYDIYSDQIQIDVDKSSDVKLGAPILPQPLLIENKVIGNYSIYQNETIIRIPVINSGSGDLILNLVFRGCRGEQYCYPAINRTLKLHLMPVNQDSQNINKLKNNQASVDPGPISNINIFNSNSSLIAKNFELHPLLNIFIFFILGILMAFTPCVFPMFPILFSIIAGKSNQQALKMTISYILGGSCVYALTGVLVSYIGISLQSYLQNIWAILFMSALLIIFSLSLFGIFEIKLPDFLTNKLHNQANKTSGSFVGIFLMGAISTLILSPCVTAPLAGALIYISSSHNILLGGIALFMLGIGVGLPLLFIALIGNKFLLPKSGKWMVKIRQILAMLMLLMAIYTLNSLLSESMNFILNGIWMLGFAYLVCKLLRHKALRVFLGIVLSVFAVSLMIYPHIKNTMQIDSNTSWKTVTDLEQLNTLARRAKEQHQIVILDFTAKWCLACREMDLTTWHDQKLHQLMQNTMNIKADVTNNDENSKVLEKFYQVFAPPTVIILDNNGNIYANLEAKSDAKMIIDHLPLAGITPVSTSQSTFAESSPEQIKIMLQNMAPWDSEEITKIRSLPLKINNVYEITKGNKVFYVSTDGHYIISGSIVDTITKTNLNPDTSSNMVKTAQIQDGLLAKNLAQQNNVWNKLPLNLAIKKVNGNGHRQLAVFTNPDCTYCRKFEKQVAPNLRDTTIYIFPCPVSLHTKQVWCSQDQLQAWNDAMNGYNITSDNTTCDLSGLDQIAQVATDVIHAQGTPTLVLNNGQVFVGMRSSSDLMLAMDQASSGKLAVNQVNSGVKRKRPKIRSAADDNNNDSSDQKDSDISYDDAANRTSQAVSIVGSVMSLFVR